MNVNLPDFVVESNRIEGIFRNPMREADEVYTLDNFLRCTTITVDNLEHLLLTFEPEARLRDQYGMNVTVGDYLPPKGGPYIRQGLEGLLENFKRGQNKSVPYLSHQYFEELHPFTDGNGRTGRALWLWYMEGNAPLGFLHTWYYQSLYESQSD